MITLTQLQFQNAVCWAHALPDFRKTTKSLCSVLPSSSKEMVEGYCCLGVAALLVGCTRSLNNYESLLTPEGEE